MSVKSSCSVAEVVLPSSPVWYSSYACDGNEAGVFVFASRNYLIVFQIEVKDTKPGNEDDKENRTMLDYHLIGMLYHSEKVIATAVGPRTRAAQKDESSLAISASQNGEVCVWELSSQKLIHVHHQHKSKVMAVAWSLFESHWIVTGDERGVLVSSKFGASVLKNFHPEKSCINCISFCPHDPYLLAVGYRTGVILLVNMLDTSSVVKKFLGHSDDITSLAWCPEPGEILCIGQDSSSDCKDEESTSSNKNTYLLASGSKDQVINIWSNSKNHLIRSIKVPQVVLKREKLTENARLWLALHWPKEEPETLVSAVQAGSMISWDLKHPGRKKYTVFETSAGCSHNRAIFSIASMASNGNILCTISQDRNMVFWDFKRRKSIQAMSTFGGYVYALHAVPLNPGCLAIGVGDNTVRIWNRNKVSSNLSLVQIWQRIKSKVTAIQWHPVIEGLLAYGTEDGRVGTMEANTHKPPTLCWSYHSRTVYTIEWGKTTYAEDSETENLPVYSLYSQGDGMILQHNLSEKERPAENINSIILNTNGKKEYGAFPNRTDIRWKPDFSLVAIGNDDGTVEIFSSPHLKYLCSVNIFSKIINCICWHPLYTTDSDKISSCSNWLALGSNDAFVPVIDITLPNKDSQKTFEKLIINSSFRLLEGHTKRITGMCWSNHSEGHLVTVSFDKTAVVWDVKSGEALARYTGHSGRLMCVIWSLTDPDLIYTGSEDCCLHAWKITLNKCDANLCIKKSVKIKKRSRGKNVVAKNKLSNKDELNSESGRNDDDADDDESVDDNETLAEDISQDKASKPKEDKELQNIDLKPLISTSSKINKKLLDTTEDDEENIKTRQFVEDILGPELMTTSKCTDDKALRIKEEKPKKCSKKYRKSMFPLCSKLEQSVREKVMKDIINLTKKIYDQTFQLESTDFHLGFFLDRRDMYLLLEKEGQFHLEHDNMEYHLHMEIWKGNINKALNNAKERDELSDWLVAMAPLASHATWLSVCEDYAHQLESDGQYHKAATYLMACHRNYDAIDLFKRHRLYKEAVAFAKVRLSPFDPVFEDLYNSWAQQLAKEGNYEQAAKCFLAIKQVKDASRCLSKRNDPICLRTAAHISLIASEKQNGFLLAHKVICQYLQKMQYQEIYNFTQEHHNLKVFTLVTSLHELMMSVLASLMPNAAYVKDNPGFVIPEIKTASSDNGKTQLPDFILDTCDMDPLCPWKPFLINNHTFLNYVLRMWHSCMNVDLSSNSNIEEMYSTLNTLISNRQNMLKADQLMIENCTDLTLCLLALLQAETSSAIKHLLQMMSSLHDVGQFELLQVISQLCLPQGPKYFLKLQQEVTAIRVLVNLDKNDDDVSKLDSTLKLNTTKRYLSDLKEDNNISNPGLRCRELDCVRAYYYIGVLRYLLDRQNSESTLIPSQSLPKIINNKTPRTEDDNSFNQTNLLDVENSEWISNQANLELNNNNNNTDANNDDDSLLSEIANQNSDNYCKIQLMVRVDYRLDFHKIRFLSKCILWDIQGKRFALTEKLGYIHKAISRLLLDQKPQNELAKSTPVDLEVSNSNHSVKYVNSSSGEKMKMIEEGSVSLQQDAVRLQAPDLIPTGHESSPSPSNPSPNEETTISSPQLVKELLSKQSSFPSSNVSSLLPSSHCSSPCCQDEESYRSATKPRKILWKDDPPLRSQVCPLHKKYINVPDSWYDLPVDKKYGQQCINMGILLDEQDLVMSELKQGPENPTQILFPHPLSTAQLLLNVIQKSEDFDNLEKLQLLEDILSWAMEYSCTSEQQHIFQSLKEQINI